jgi:hypothetical protein
METVVVNDHHCLSFFNPSSTVAAISYHAGTQYENPDLLSFHRIPDVFLLDFDPRRLSRDQLPVSQPTNER